MRYDGVSFRLFIFIIIEIAQHCSILRVTVAHTQTKLYAYAFISVIWPNVNKTDNFKWKCWCALCICTPLRRIAWVHIFYLMFLSKQRIANCIFNKIFMVYTNCDASMPNTYPPWGKRSALKKCFYLSYFFLLHFVFFFCIWKMISLVDLINSDANARLFNVF